VEFQFVDFDNGRYEVGYTAEDIGEYRTEVALKVGDKDVKIRGTVYAKIHKKSSN
jgi:hypothetical protein